MKHKYRIKSQGVRKQEIQNYFPHAQLMPVGREAGVCEHRRDVAAIEFGMKQVRAATFSLTRGKLSGQFIRFDSIARNQVFKDVGVSEDSKNYFRNNNQSKKTILPEQLPQRRAGG